MTQDEKSVEQMQRDDGRLGYPKQIAARVALLRRHREQHSVPQRGDTARQVCREQHPQKQRRRTAHCRHKLRSALQIRHDVTCEEQVEGHHGRIVGERSRNYQHVSRLVKRRRGCPRCHIPQRHDGIRQADAHEAAAHPVMAPALADKCMNAHYRAKKRTVSIKPYVEQIEQTHGRILSLSHERCPRERQSGDSSRASVAPQCARSHARCKKFR